MTSGIRDLRLIVDEREEDEELPKYHTVVKDSQDPSDPTSATDAHRNSQFIANNSGTAAAELPPEYTSFDSQADVFTFGAPLIFGTATSTVARYHVSQRLTKSGKPYQLRIRRLLGTESRRLSAPLPERRHPRNSFSSGSNASLRRDSAVAVPPVFYDEETTMYIVSNHDSVLSTPASRLGLISSAGIEIKGCRSHTLPGVVRVERVAGDLGGRRARAFRFWHRTRNAANDSLAPENEGRMQKYGYRADDEWNSELLFTVRERRRGTGAYEWRDEREEVVAVDEDGKLEIRSEKRKRKDYDLFGDGEVERNPAEGIDASWRDLIVTCWAARAWSLKDFVVDGVKS